jgi:hypothetical protein
MIYLFKIHVEYITGIYYVFNVHLKKQNLYCTVEY